MYSRRSTGFPRWFTALIAGLLVISGYFIVRGFLTFVDAGGDIVSPQLTTTAAYYAQIEKITRQYLSTLDFTHLTPIGITPTQTCTDYRVRVVKARIRDCAREECETIAMLNEGQTVCVVGVSPDDPDWYTVIVDPTDPIVETGYMHQSVVISIKPRQSATPTLDLATVTPIPTTSTDTTLASTIPPNNPTNTGSVTTQPLPTLTSTSEPPSNTPPVSNTPKQRPVPPPGS